MRQHLDTRSASVHDDLRWPSGLDDLLPVGLLESSLELVISRVNHTICELTGSTAQELVGRSYLDLLHQDDRALEHAALVRLPGASGVEITATRLVRKDGTTAWVEARHTVLRDASGGPRSLLTIVRDVTEGRRRLAELRESEERFRLALLHSPVVVWTQDRDLRFTWVSNVHKPFSEEALIGRTEWEVLPADVAERTTRVKLRAMESRQLAREEVSYILDGVEYAYDQTAEPIFDAAGAVVGVRCASMDVTQRRRSEAVLRRTEQRFRDTFEQAAVGMAEVSIDGRFLQANQRLCDIVGYTREQLQQLRFQDITWHEDRAADLVTAQRMLAGELSRGVLDKRYVRRDGSLVWVTITASLVRSPSGAPYYFVAVVQDITDRKRAQADVEAARAQAEEANRLKDEFIATLSHELRTPLNAMLGWTHLLKSGLLPPDQHAKAVETIERNARAQARLLADILDVSRIVTGKLTLERHPTPLAPVVDRVIEDMRLTVMEKRLDVTFTRGEREAVVLGEPARLQQVVWNLVSNAVKFTPAGGRIELTLAVNGAEVTLAVRDTGAGIAADFLPLVFDRFRQADASSSRRHAGLGLGLAIVKHLVELHGGTVTAESPGPDRGAVFTVRLPLVAPARPPGSREPVEAREQVSLKGLRVLVVDDHDDARELVRVVFEKHGADVLAAASTPQAVEAYVHHACEVALIDLSMPGEDGFACLAKLRQLAAQHQRPLRAIALTAHTGEAFRGRALAEGFTSHVAKPISPEQLVRVVADLAGDPA